MEYVIAIAVLFVVVYYVANRGKGMVKNSSTISTTPSPVTAPVVADVNNNGITSKAELKTLTKVQLFDFAEKRSLKVKKSGTKAQVITEIHSQLK
jgi:hypothetical protein